MYTAAEIKLVRSSKPELKLAGIDTSVGFDFTASQLFDATAMTFNYAGHVAQPGVVYDAANKRIIVTGNGVVLSGYDFNGVTLYIGAKNVTVQNCTFEAGESQWYSIQDMSSGATIKNCVFTGGSEGSNYKLSAFIAGSSMTLDGDKFINSPADAVHINSGVVQNCYFSGEGYSSNGSHPDAIWITNTDGSTLIQNNFIDWTANGVHAGNNAVRITTELGNVSDVTVTHNVLLGGTNTIQPGSTTGTMSNVKITDNVIGFGLYGAFYYSSLPGVTISGNTIADFTNPIYSTNAWQVYSAAGVKTSRLLVSTNAADLTAPATGSTTLYGANTSEHLVGSASAETVFIGGAGCQYDIAGKGANIFKYLAFSDSTTISADGIYGFDTARDVIDVSAINANPAGAAANFNFIGQSAFTSAGGQVRFYYDLKSNLTIVEATMAGDSTADFRIRLNGVLDLTAANFALTSAQADADLAAGAALNVTRTAGSAGGNLYAYTNVLNRSYTSFESVFDASSQLAAHAYNFPGGVGSVDMIGAGLVYSDGPKGETLKVGNSNFSLGAHATETLQLQGAAEVLQFHSGFGSASLSGFGADDRLQLDKSMFSYINSGMTQAQDFAALLSHATRDGSDLVIRDSSGDRLTLSGLTATQFAASAGSVTFV